MARNTSKCNMSYGPGVDILREKQRVILGVHEHNYSCENKGKSSDFKTGLTCLDTRRVPDERTTILRSDLVRKNMRHPRFFIMLSTHNIREHKRKTNDARLLIDHLNFLKVGDIV